MKEIIFFRQKFHSCTLEEANRYVSESIEKGAITIIGCLNVFYITLCEKNNFVSNFYNKNCNLITVDGRILVYLSKFLSKYPFPEMIGGPNLINRILEYNQYKDYKYYFIGSTDKILEKAEINLKKKYQGFNLIGKHNGYFDIEGKEMDLIIKDIKKLDPDIIFVGLSSPLKEKIANKLKLNLEYGTIVLVGGMFDVFAGEKKIGNKLVSYLMLDWLYRLIQEPKRLFGRYMKSNILFLYLIFREIFTKFKNISIKI